MFNAGHKGHASDATLDHATLLALLNNMSEAFLATDENGTVILSNGAALDLLDINTLQGKSINTVIKLVDKNNAPVDPQQLITNSTKTLIGRDWKLRYADGSTTSIYWSSSPIRRGFGAKGQSGYVLVMRDISREKSLEEERAEFISVASHELRTPVAIVEGNVSNAMVLAEQVGAPESVKHSLASAHDQTIFLGNLINDLAMLSRAERGNLDLEVKDFSVGELIDSLAHDYSPQAELKSLAIKKQVEEGVGNLISSELYVREMLQNFITNAIKYTEKGSITITAAKKDEGIEFGVADTGIGISQSDQNKLFSKFFRADDWRVRKANGTGLGLYVTAKLAKLLGASIDMISKFNEGTTFKVYVPNSKKKP